jgi:hypothetical protein
MAGKRKTDWWETFLWVGVFFLMLIFLYELLKLWNSTTKTVGGLISSIPQALTNAIGTVESGLASLVTSPFTAIANLLDSGPGLLNLVLGFFSSLFLGSFWSDILTAFTSIFGGLALPVTTGLGSSASGTNLNPSTANDGGFNQIPILVQGQNNPVNVGNDNGFGVTSE